MVGFLRDRLSTMWRIHPSVRHITCTAIPFSSHSANGTEKGMVLEEQQRMLAKNCFASLLGLKPRPEYSLSTTCVPLIAVIVGCVAGPGLITAWKSVPEKPDESDGFELTWTVNAPHCTIGRYMYGQAPKRVGNKMGVRFVR